MVVPLILLFILVPIAELALIIQVGQEIGLLWTVAILVADSVLGSLLMRSQGRAAWRRFNEAMQAGRPPAREVLDGVLVIFGGALLLTPGFITDIVGLSFLAPPTRAVLRRLLVKRFAERMIASATRPRAPRQPTGTDGDVEGTGVEVEPGALPPRRS